MPIRKHFSCLVLLLACGMGMAQTSSSNPCEAILPAKLREILTQKYPGYRMARISDYLREDVEQHKKEHKGNPCLGVASTDVDGDGFPDFAFFLTNKAKHTCLISARNPSGKTWEVFKLYDFGKEGPGHSYVEPLESGSYQDLFDINDENPSEFTPEPGRVRKFKAKHAGFIAGSIESSGIAFFFSGKRWVHLWLSD